ncbi:hypothetical protein LC55x_1878 [Lysobacter capsici]|nr:hypothetical protein LC55x_1878 [Lysobacter capsici]
MAATMAAATRKTQKYQGHAPSDLLHCNEVTARISKLVAGAIHL